MPEATLLLNNPDYLREPQVAEATGLAPSTLAKMRSRGGGPPFVKVGRVVRYPEDKLLEWVANRTQHSGVGPPR
jgi:predicted DNA-binding transcriptional regulator AlpA